MHRRPEGHAGKPAGQPRRVRQANQASTAGGTVRRKGAEYMDTTEGIVIREHRGVFDVETRHGTFACALRSRMKKALIYPERDNQHHSVEQVGRIAAVNPVAIGDRVRFVEDQGETGADSR